MSNQDDFPIFDGHSHFCQAYLEQALASYSECGVKGGINLWGPGYHDYRGFLELCHKRGLEKQFAQFYWPDWRIFGSDPTGFVTRLCEDMRLYSTLGASGLKVWKNLGMAIRHTDNTPATMDDDRLHPVWQTAEELGWTIAVHQADPTGFFESATRTELTREDLFACRDRVVSEYPNIPFILCHNGNDMEDWDRLSEMFERLPHINADLRKTDRNDYNLEKKLQFLEKYHDRLYLGVDMGMPMDRPPDREWNLNCCYRPLRESLSSLGLSERALKHISWENGCRDFLDAH